MKHLLAPLLGLALLLVAACETAPMAFVAEDVPDSTAARVLPPGCRIKRGETLHLARWAQQAPTADYLLLPAIPLLDSLQQATPLPYKLETVGQIGYGLYIPPAPIQDTLRIAVRHAKCAAWAAWQALQPQLQQDGLPTQAVVCYQPGEAQALQDSSLVQGAVLATHTQQAAPAATARFPLLLGRANR